MAGERACFFWASWRGGMPRSLSLRVERVHCIGWRDRGGVCNLLFINRYMRPEGPWQRLAAALTDSSGIFIHDLVLAQTDNR